MIKNFKIILTVIILAAVVGGIWVWQKYKGALPALTPALKDITKQIPASNSSNIPDAVNNTDFPLKLPKGFTISIFAKNLPGARALAMDSFGNLWLSQTGNGTVSRIKIKDGKAVNQQVMLKGLNRPHGLAFGDFQTLYVAEETKISNYHIYLQDTSDDVMIGPNRIVNLPTGGRHFTRTLGIGPDGRLYVSIGSICDVCNEKDERVASIYSMNKDGSDFKKVASGLRNSVFFTWNEVHSTMWATEMGRDNLGDDLPPDEINFIDTVGIDNADFEARDYGWPVCYGQNIHDTNFDKNVYIQNPCNGKIPPAVELPAHSAPLGLAFLPETTNLPEDYWLDLIVAFHGSWNRSQPTGYKLARIKLDDKGNFQGMEDFISGWLAKDGKTSLGRPVDVLALPSGIIYVSDDKAGVVYKIQYLGNQTASTNSDVVVESPKENSVVKSPLKVTGKAKGTWFFEASLPVEIFDANWKSLGQSFGQAQGEWMTTNFVNFESTLTFSTPTTDSGWLVIRKDNPSGLPANDAEVHYPIKFK